MDKIFNFLPAPLPHVFSCSRWLMSFVLLPAGGTVPRLHELSSLSLFFPSRVGYGQSISVSNTWSFLRASFFSLHVQVFYIASIKNFSPSWFIVFIEFFCSNLVHSSQSFVEFFLPSNISEDDIWHIKLLTWGLYQSICGNKHCKTIDHPTINTIKPWTILQYLSTAAVENKSTTESCDCFYNSTQKSCSFVAMFAAA